MKLIAKEINFLIVGLGLMGGSYAKALKKLGFTVSAIDTREDAITYALKEGIIDHGAATADPTLITEADILNEIYRACKDPIIYTIQNRNRGKLQ